MFLKKNPNADLEKRRTLFFEIGLVIALALTFISFEWPTKVRDVVEIRDLVDLNLEEEMIPITRQEELREKPKLPPKIQLTDVITIVENNTEIIKLVEDKSYPRSKDVPITPITIG